MSPREAQLSSAFDALARIAEESDARLRDGLADAMSEMLATIGQVQEQHAEQYQALRQVARALLPLARERAEVMQSSAATLSRYLTAEARADVEQRAAAAELVVSLADDVLGGGR